VRITAAANNGRRTSNREAKRMSRMTASSYFQRLMSSPSLGQPPPTSLR
jgi:hypothetical protein